MTPLPEHEFYKEVIGDFVKDIAEELEVNYESYGLTTWKRESKMAGVESDNLRRAVREWVRQKGKSL